jgi:hypothetical protein
VPTEEARPLLQNKQSACSVSPFDDNTRSSILSASRNVAERHSATEVDLGGREHGKEQHGDRSAAH